MKKCNRYIFLFCVIQVCFLTHNLTAQERFNKLAIEKSTFDPAGTPRATLLNINNITSWIQSNGESGHNPIAQKSGIIYPRGTAGVIYLDGLVWGGYVQDPDTSKPGLRVGGHTYRIGITPGRIISNGVAQSPNDPDVRIYRIRKDWQTISDVELSLDAAELYNLPLSEVTQPHINAVRSQYGKDWSEWPIQYGAPFYDINGNGIYEPVLGEEPGLQNADQVIWFVCNDLDESATYSFHGSPPMGLELQVTLWGHNVDGALGQMQFRRYRLINKSGFDIDPMYLGQWSDVDLGDYGNDLTGCDTLLDLGYCYNGYSADKEYQKFNLPPPAIGYALLQGPLVPSSGETAIVNFQEITDYKNLSMTSSYYNASGGQYSDPALGSYQGAKAWWNLLRGFVPLEDIDNPTPWYEGSDPNNPVTKFPVAGDPVTGIGDVDHFYGGNLQPGDRQIAIFSGPFSLSQGESQEVVIALVGGINLAGDNLTSVTELKNNVQFIRSLYPAVTKCSKQVRFPSNIETGLTIKADLFNYDQVTNCEINFSPEIGQEPEFNLTLFDDGLHNDNEAGDNVWGNSITISNRKYPYKGDLIVQTSTSTLAEQKILPNAYNNLRLRPLAELINCTVEWENGKQDSKINNGEKIHLAFDIYNPDEINSIEGLEIDDINVDPSIPPGGTLKDEKFFLIRTAPSAGDSASFFYSLQFDNFRDLSKVVQPIESWIMDPIWGDTLEVTSVSGVPYNIHPVIADRSLLTGHTYMISFMNNDSLIWRITDQTLGEIKIDAVPYSEDPDYPYPVIDGIQWQVTSPPLEIKDWFYESRDVSPLYPDYDRGRWFSGNAGGTGIFGGLYISDNFQGSTIDDADLVPVEVHFTHMTGYSDDDGSGTWDPLETYQFNTAEGSGAFTYSTWGPGNYTGFFDVPCQAFDVSDPDNPRRLNLFLRDWDGSRQWELESDDTPYNYLWILATDYDATGALYDPTQGGQDLMDGDGGLSPGYYMYRGVPRGSREFLAESGVLSIVPYKYNRPGDSLLVIAPTATANITDLDEPVNYELHQNFPNPFNHKTRIDVSLKKESRIDIEIYNILGQRVKTLVKNEKLLARRHEYFWDGQNDNSRPVSSGIYFYRLNVNSGELIKTKKLIFIK